MLYIRSTCEIRVFLVGINFFSAEFADEQAQQAISEALEYLDHSQVRTTSRIAHSDEGRLFSP